MSATSTEREIRGCSGKGIPLTQQVRRYRHASQRYVNDFGLPCRWETENHLLPGWCGVVVSGAELRLAKPPDYFTRVMPLLAFMCAFTTTERALYGFTITSKDLSGVVNALTCCVVVSPR